VEVDKISKNEANCNHDMLGDDDVIFVVFLSRVCQLVVGVGIACDRGTDRFGLDKYLGFVGKRKRI